MKRWIVGGSIAAVLAAVIIASVLSGGPRGEKVYVELAKRRDIEEIVSAPGEIDPKVKVNISAHVIGKIEKLHFKEGDFVHRGQLLVDLERVAYAALHDRAASEVTGQRLEIEKAKNNLANAKLGYDRAIHLRKEGIETQELYEAAQLNYQNAQTGLDAAQQGLLQSVANLAQADNDLEHTTILSPMDGRVVEVNAHEGEVVVTGTMNNPGSVIATIADLSEILVDADVAETEVVKVRIGQSVRIKVDAVADKEYRGHVAEIGSSATQRQGSTSGLRYFTVKTALDNGDERLRPGMTSEVEIITATMPKAVSVPVQSVVERVPPSAKKRTATADDDSPETPKLKYVLTVRNDKVHLVEVQTGISNATHVAIVSGLKDSEKVITGPFKTLKALKEDAPVQQQKEPEHIEADDTSKETS